jgi:hypothetical protein
MDELFTEEYLTMMIDWGGLVHTEDGSYYIDKNISPDVLCFEKWYLKFPVNQVWVPKMLASKALKNLNEYMLITDYDSNKMKEILLKEIAFEYVFIKSSGDLDSLFASLN